MRMRFSLKTKLIIVIGLMGVVPIVGVAFNSYNLSAVRQAGAKRDIDVETIAPGHATGGIDRHGFEHVPAGGIGKADPQRAFLANALAAAATCVGHD